MASPHAIPRHRRGILRLTALGAAVALVLAGCSPAPGSSDPGASSSSSEPRELVVSQGADAASLDPLLDSGTEAANVNLAIFDGLVRTNATSEIVPGIAEAWTQVDDLTWRFELRDNASFHNGEPVTADDVKFSIDTILDPGTESGLAGYIEPITSVTVLDEHTIELKLDHPYATLLAQLARAVSIVPKALYEQEGSEQFSLSPVGSGPFTFVSWTKDVELKLAKNEAYWAGVPQLDSLVFRPLPEASARLAALRTGEVDIATELSADQAAEIEGEEGIRIESGKDLTQLMLQMNSAFAPFDDPKVRQAINYAIDKQLIVDQILRGHGTVLGGPYAPLSFGYDPSLEPYPYDPDKAKSLLAEAGYPDGFSTTFTRRAGGGISGLDDQVDQAIVAQLLDVGIKADVVSLEYAEYTAQSKSPETKGLIRVSLRDAIGDGDYMLGLWYDSTRRSPYFNTPELDAKIQAQLSQSDRDARFGELKEIAQYIHDNAGVGFLFAVDTIYGVRDGVGGWIPRGDRTILIDQTVTNAE